MTLFDTKTPGPSAAASVDAGTVGERGSSSAVPRVVGLDLSLRATGVAFNHGTELICTAGHKGDDLASRTRRLHSIRNQVLAWCRGADLVVIESPSLNTQYGAQSERVGLYWLIIDRLVANDIPVATMAPAQRAKFATGNGNAGKDKVLAAVINTYPQFEVTSNDVADAVVLHAAGLYHLGHPLVVLPDSHRSTLAKVAWPEVGA